MSARVEAAIPAVCALLKPWMDGPDEPRHECRRCPASIETPYGAGVQGCRMEAEAIARAALAAADRVSLAGTEEALVKIARQWAEHWAHHNETGLANFARMVVVRIEAQAAALAGLAGENAKLKAALKEIGREQSYATARAAADSFQSIARAALQEPPDAP